MAVVFVCILSLVLSLRRMGTMILWNNYFATVSAEEYPLVSWTGKVGVVPWFEDHDSAKG